MSRNGNKNVQDPLNKRNVQNSRGQPEERLVVVSHDWFVPIQLVRRLSSINADNELESLVFPSDESFESQWQLYLEHQSHPPRIRIGLCLLSPRDRCLQADIKLILITTHGGQVIREGIFNDHTFFLAKGDPLSSFINQHISPKIYLDIEDDVYQDMMSNTKENNPLHTDDCTIMAYVRFINELDIQPRTKAFDSSRRFTVDWKLTKFHQIIEQINQSRPPIGNDRRFVSDLFRFTHTKITDSFKAKQWRLLIKHPRTPSSDRQTPLYLTIKCSDMIRANYGKVELRCKYEQNVLRRYTQSYEDLMDNYTIEFFTLEELAANVYKYRHDFNENNGRFFTIDYLLFNIQIVQPLQKANVPKSIKRVVEPTVISLTSTGKIQSKGPGQLLKATREARRASVAKIDTKSFASIHKIEEKKKSPEYRSVSRENTLATSGDSQAPSRDPFSDEPRSNHSLPPIISRNQPSSDRLIQSPTRHQAFNDNKPLPNIRENLPRSPRSFQNKSTRRTSQSRLQSLDRFNPQSSIPSHLPSASTTSLSVELPDNFTFLNNLFRSGLHSDITIRNGDRQWNLHKSILSTRSIYFNQLFASSNSSELNLSNDVDTPPSIILEKIFLFLYTNQYSSLSSPSQSPSPVTDKKPGQSFDALRSLFEGANKYGVDVLALLCLQDMCHPPYLTINNAAILLISLHQALNDPYKKYHSQDYLAQIKTLKQTVLRFIQFHSREVLLSSQWKFLEKHYPALVHDVLEFVVFEKIVE